MSDPSLPPDITPTAPEPPRPAATPRPAAFWAGLLFDALLIALIGVGLFFRFSWTNWSQDADLHPDEYGLTSTLTRLALPQSLAEYFNTRISPISPYQKYDEVGNPTEPGPDNRMRWGQWPIILLKWGAELTDNTGYREQRLFGRQFSALVDSLALLVILLIGARLFHYRVGLMAAALSALAVMQIQQSHFMTSDTFAVLFTTLAMYAAVRVAFPAGPARAYADEAAAPRSSGWRAWPWYLVFGVFFGMAVAARINLAPLGGMILVAALIAHQRELRTEATAWAALQRVVLLCALAGLVGVATFRVTQPMSFRAKTGDTTIFTVTPNQDWLDSLAVSQAESNLEAGGPPAEQWTARPRLLFPLVNMVLWGMGLPFGLAAWGALAWAAWRCLRADWGRHFLRDVAPLLLPAIWVGGFFLFMGTRAVMSVRYFLPIYPFLALLAAWALAEVWRLAAEAGRRNPPVGAWPALGLRLLAFGLPLLVLGGTLAWAYGYTGIYRADNTRLQASRWIYENIPGPFNARLTLPDGSGLNEPLAFPEGVPLMADASYQLEYRPRFSGQLTEISVARARNTFDPNQAGVLRVVVAADPDGQQVLAEARLAVTPDLRDARGGPASAVLSQPVPVEQDTAYFLLISAPEGGPIQVTGSTVTNENWDESVPVRMFGRDPYGGLYRGLTMEVHWLDDENKRQMYLANLEQADYIFVQSQRRIWASTRLPARYPMTMAYYRALFDGQLGYDLVAQFHTPITVGPLQVSDLTGTAAWGRAPDVPALGPDYPFNYSLWAAEEAFSVYDHAPVWIFKKRADFDIEQAATLLFGVDLTQVIDQSPRDGTLAPTLMLLPPDLAAIQRAGGTWSAMFDATSLINTSEPVAVAAWYLALLVLGALAFPLAFTAFGGLPDRGYPLAKTVALLVVAWLVWMAGSLRLLPFTRTTIALGFLVLALISAGLAWLQRAALLAYLRAHWRHMLITEAVALALFALMLFIRWANPDLWHPYYGGEKPMDFSYFNAVLKSTYFPPYDPWLAGGYLNYYYYGFVVAGLLTKLLGVMPALAYNLILPMLFSLVGVNAFCAAYNLVEGARRREPPAPRGPEAAPPAIAPEVLAPAPDGPSSEAVALTDGESLALAQAGPAAETVALAEAPAPAVAPVAVTPTIRPASATPNPYLAGVAAALLIVVLGNLGQVRTYLTGFQRAADRAALADSVFGDNGVTATIDGVWRVLSGKAELGIALGSWYWDATRIVPNVNGSGSEITEFPFFTFLYADLHAHMIVMPFTVMAIAWAIAYLQGFGQARRWWESAAVWAIGGLVIGVTRPSNTWDYPMYMALGAAAVLGAHLLGRKPGESWQALALAVGARVVLLVALTLLLYRPFDQWVAVPLTELKQWEGEKTPIEAYLYVHGLFLFCLVTFLVVETGRWLAETPATVLNHLGDWLAPLGVALAALLVCVAIFLYLGVTVVVIALPLLVWAGLVLLRGRAALAPEKRAVVFMLGTGLAVTLFVDVVVLGGDRMNTIFKLYMQVWMLFSIAAAAALAWAWAAQPRWPVAWRSGWSAVLVVLVAAAALYTVTAAGAKMRDRFIAYAASPEGAGCQPIPGMALPYTQGAPADEQPRGLNGLAYMTVSAYCDKGFFLPLAYDYDAIRWLQANVQGSPVIVEAQTFDLYRLSSRYAWNTGLPNVVGWDWHQRQQRGAGPTGFITERGVQVTEFYLTVDEAAAEEFLREYDVRYIIVGPMERAYYPDTGLAKFETLAAAGRLERVYTNPGVTVYAVPAPPADQGERVPFDAAETSWVK